MELFGISWEIEGRRVYARASAAVSEVNKCSRVVSISHAGCIKAVKRPKIEQMESCSRLLTAAL